MFFVSTMIVRPLKNLFGMIQDGARSLAREALFHFQTPNVATIYSRQGSPDFTFNLPRNFSDRDRRKLLKHYFRDKNVWCVEVGGKPYFRRGKND